MALNYKEKTVSRARALHNSTKHQRSIVTQGFPCEELKQQEWHIQPFLPLQETTQQNDIQI